MLDTQQGYDSRTAQELSGVSVRQINHWDGQGLVKPSVRPASGTGSRRLYSFTDLLALVTVKRFRDAGVSLQKIRKAVAYLRAKLPGVQSHLTRLTLVTDGQSIFYLGSDQREIVDAVKRGQYVMAVAIGEIVEQLQRLAGTLALPQVHEVTVGDFAYQAKLTPDADDGGFVAECEGLPGCLTQGETVEETLRNLRDAIESYLDVHGQLAAEGVTVPVQPGRKVKRSVSQARRSKSA